MSPRAKFVAINLTGWLLIVLAFGILVRWNSQNGVYTFFVVLAIAFGFAIGSLFLNTESVRAGATSEALVPFFLVLGMCFLFAPIFSSRGPNTKDLCLSRVKQLTTALMIYAADYDDCMPAVHNWRDATGPLIKAEDQYLKCLDSKAPYSHAMNDAMSMVNLMKVKRPEKTILLFESSSQVPNAIGNQESFIRRHNERGTVGFADGSARMIRNDPGEVRWTP